MHVAEDMERPTVLPSGRPKRATSPRYGRMVHSRHFAMVDERRSAWRYQLKLALKYNIRDKGALQIGSGETRDISSQSLRFTADTPLPAKSLIELSIDWPAKRDEAPPLRLTVIGTVLRCTSTDVVVLINRYGLDPAAAPAPA